jgi:hypothetical protein
VTHRVGRCIALLFYDRGTKRGWWVVSSTPWPHFTPRKDQSGWAENLAPTGIRSRTVQPVVSRYTDWATWPTLWDTWDIKIQNTFRYLATNKIKQITETNTHNTVHKWHQYNLKQIKMLLEKNNLMKAKQVKVELWSQHIQSHWNRRLIPLYQKIK